MTDTPQGPWKSVVIPEWAAPIGYSNAIITQGGRMVHLAGQTAMDPQGKIIGPGDLVMQATQAFANVRRVLDEAGAKPEHMVRARIYVCSADDYAAGARAIGSAWRDTFGRWFPAMTLVQVARLYDPEALIEVETEAVIPDAADA